MSWLAIPTFSEPSAAHAATRIEAPLRLVKIAVPLMGRPAAIRVCSSVILRVSGVELVTSWGVARRTVWRMRFTSVVDCTLPEPDPETSTLSDGTAQLVSPAGCLVSQSATYARSPLTSKLEHEA